MADSQLILELLFLHRRGDCSLTVLLFFLMLMGTCCFILSANDRLAKRNEHFNEQSAMKRRQRRSKQIKYAHSCGFVGFMRKIGIEHGNDEN